MILKNLSLLSLLLLASCNEATIAEKLEVLDDNALNTMIDETVDVYIAKGNTQCNDDGLTLEETISYLTNENIAVTESQCGVLEGISFTSVCGGGSPDIYIHTIKATDLDYAANIGFKATTLLSAGGLTYTVVNCPAS